MTMVDGTQKDQQSHGYSYSAGIPTRVKCGHSAPKAAESRNHGPLLLAQLNELEVGDFYQLEIQLPQRIYITAGAHWTRQDS